MSMVVSDKETAVSLRKKIEHEIERLNYSMEATFGVGSIATVRSKRIELMRECLTLIDQQMRVIAVYSGALAALTIHLPDDAQFNRSEAKLLFEATKNDQMIDLAVSWLEEEFARRQEVTNSK